MRAAPGKEILHVDQVNPLGFPVCRHLTQDFPKARIRANPQGILVARPDRLPLRFLC
jgi:hypothetical protein